MSELLAAVDERFAITGAATPGWPDPHPGLAAPEDWEYSHCADPAKYLILQARLAAWRDVLVARGAMVEEPGDDDVLVWRPVARGALPLVVRSRSFDEVPGNLVELGVGGGPTEWLRTLPDCGCDACDDGSAHYLQRLDDLVAEVVSGAFVHLRTSGGATVHTNRSGWDGTGHLGTHDEVVALITRARAGELPGGALHGAPWL